MRYILALMFWLSLATYSVADFEPCYHPQEQRWYRHGETTMIGQVSYMCQHGRWIRQ